MNEITTTHNTGIIRSFDDAAKAAQAMSASGFFSDTRSAQQAIVKIMAGMELGFGPFASMTGVAIIQGKPAIGANLQAAAIKRTGKYNYRVVEMSDTVVELMFLEAGKEIGKSRFTMQDAQAAGLNGKDNWKKFPRNMLFARAISNGVRWYAPDIFNGATVYTPDELGASEDADGNIIDVTPAPVQQAQPIMQNTQFQKPAARTESVPEPENIPAQSLTEFVEDLADLKPAPSELTLEQALTFVASNGQKYSDRTDDQLMWVAKNDKTPALKKQAALLILKSRGK